MVDVGGFALLLRLGLIDVGAAFASFMLATLVNFNLSARFVFAGSTSIRTYLLFLLAASIGLLVNVSITVMTMRALSAGPVPAKIAGIGCALVLNFLLNRLVVFRSGARS